MPALRQRRADIPSLVQYFLKRAARDNEKSVRGLSLGALNALQSASWPGNVRQLQREMERLVTVCPPGKTIESPMISPTVLSPATDEALEAESDDLDLKRQLARLEKRLVQRALDQAGGNHSEAARLLGVTRNGLTMKTKRLGIVGAPGDD